MQYGSTLFALSCYEVQQLSPFCDLLVLDHLAMTFALVAKAASLATNLLKIALLKADAQMCVPHHQSCQSRVRPHPLQVLLHPLILEKEKKDNKLIANTNHIDYFTKLQFIKLQ